MRVKSLFVVAAFVAFACTVSAQPQYLTLTTPAEFSEEATSPVGDIFPMTFSDLSLLPVNADLNTEKSIMLMDTPYMSDGWFKQRISLESASSMKERKFIDELSLTGFPLVAAGIAVRGQRASFRQDYRATSGEKARLLTSFKTHIDDYTQLVPFALASGLNLAGYEGRSSTPRYLVSAGLSYAVMAAIVNPIKYSAKEMRPDGSTANSFPSGHTATAFASATILHKEYGMTRSPWFSIGGYGLATATGIMRVLNNRHWVSDIFAGAGIGIISTELGYGIGDLIFKDRGLRRNDLEGIGNTIYKPTFFALSMGMGFGNHDLSFDVSDGVGLSRLNDEGEPTDPILDLKFRPSTVVGVEGAYFFNTYFGIGGRLRVVSTPISGWDRLMERVKSEYDYYPDMLSEVTISGSEGWSNAFGNINFNMESDHLTEFTADLGAYFNFPLSNRLALGSKVLVGRSIYQALDISCATSGERFSMDLADTGLELKPTGETYSYDSDFLSVSANNTMKWGTGISLTYAYKANFAWRVFADWDCAHKTYTLENNDLELYKAMSSDAFEGIERKNAQIKKTHHTFTFGGSFMISF